MLLSVHFLNKALQQRFFLVNSVCSNSVMETMQLCKLCVWKIIPLPSEPNASSINNYRTSVQDISERNKAATV